MNDPEATEWEEPHWKGESTVFWVGETGNLQVMECVCYLYTSDPELLWLHHVIGETQAGGWGTVLSHLKDDRNHNRAHEPFPHPSGRTDSFRTDLRWIRGPNESREGHEDQAAFLWQGWSRFLPETAKIFLIISFQVSWRVCLELVKRQHKVKTESFDTRSPFKWFNTVAWQLESMSTEIMATMQTVQRAYTRSPTRRRSTLLCSGSIQLNTYIKVITDLCSSAGRLPWKV